MPTDLDAITVPFVRDPGLAVYDPVNAWPSAPAYIVLQIESLVGGVCQIGYDPVTSRYWIRSMRYAGGGWSDWASTSGQENAPPVPVSGQLSADKLSVIIGFDLSLDPNSTPLPDAFALVCNTQNRPVLTVLAAPPTSVRLTVQDTMPFSAAIDVSYIAPTINPLRSVDSINVASFQNFRIQ